jgi:hypothetical protein
MLMLQSVQVCYLGGGQSVDPVDVASVRGGEGSLHVLLEHLALAGLVDDDLQRLAQTVVVVPLRVYRGLLRDEVQIRGGAWRER